MPFVMQHCSVTGVQRLCIRNCIRNADVSKKNISQSSAVVIRLHAVVSINGGIIQSKVKLANLFEIVKI